jgi:hypothetical protein
VCCHCGLAILHFKKYLKAKERIMEETQIFHHAKKKKPNLPKNPLKKETKILQDIISL